MQAPQLHTGPWQPGVQTSEQGNGLLAGAGVSWGGGGGGHDEAESPSVGKTANWIQLLLREGTEGEGCCGAKFPRKASTRGAHRKQTPCELPLAPPIGRTYQSRQAKPVPTARPKAEDVSEGLALRHSKEAVTPINWESHPPHINFS